jgi:MFS family permease
VGSEPDVIRRNAVITACVVTGAGMALGASSNYILDPMAQEFSLDPSQTTQLKFIPGMATVFVVFIAGLLGDRVGRRRALSWGTLLMIAGAALTGVSTNELLSVTGLTLMSAGTSMMIVLSLSLLSSSTQGATERAKAFGTLGLVSPLVFLVAPLVAGAFVTYLSWRYVVLMWLAAGILALLVTARLMPKETGSREAGEMITPILAGVALVCVTQVLNAMSNDGLTSSTTLIRLALAVGSIVALWAVHRALKNPSLSFGPLRRSRSVMLLVATLVIPLASMWYTTYLLFQYLFGLTALQISLIMIPAQLTGIIGAKLASRVIIRIGLTSAGLLAFLALAAAEASFLLVGTGGTGGVVLTAILMAAFSLITSVVTVIMSNSVMDSAPSSESGTMSSYRAASSRVGSAVASLVVGTLVFSTYQTSLDSGATAAGLDTTTANQIAQELADSTSSGQDAQPPQPSAEVDEVSQIQKTAMIDALEAKALFGVAMALGAGMVFVLGMRGRRRDEQHEDGSPQGSATSGSPGES